jgi:hypothetical protein
MPDAAGNPQQRPVGPHFDDLDLRRGRGRRHGTLAGFNRSTGQGQ